MNNKYGKHSYDKSKELDHALYKMDTPFYAIVMCLMHRADTDNLGMLQMCWPDVWRELQMRYNSPRGIIPGDPEWDKLSDADRAYATREMKKYCG